MATKIAADTDSMSQDLKQDPKDRWKTIVLIILKILGAIFFLYMFVFSIGFLSDAFQVLGGSYLNRVLDDIQDILSNPFCGLIIGILVTVVCQSSSTSTSIFITMVAAGLLTVGQAIYTIMGANIGTSVTSAIVAFGNVGTPSEFRAAMEAAVLVAAFNWVTVFILLPLEIICGMLEKMTWAIVEQIGEDNGIENKLFNPIKYITNPLKQFFIKIDKSGLGSTNYTGTFVKYCKEHAADGDCNNPLANSAVCMVPVEFDCQWNNHSATETFEIFYGSDCVKVERHMFVNACWSDAAIGGICLVISLVFMFISLAGVVKCLKSVLEGSITRLIKQNIDKNLPYPFAWLTGFCYMCVGLVLTVAVQSSSIILAILTPLVGIGVISLDRAFSVTAGCQIGTTITGLIAALANIGTGFKQSMQIALVHLFFNIFGTVIWTIFPFMRRVPLGIAEFGGIRTEKYRWWGIGYLVGMYAVIPILVFGISVGSTIAATVLLVTLVVVVAFIATINSIRRCRPKMLPWFLASWKWLPIGCRSLEPYDRLICSNPKLCCNKKVSPEEAHVD